MSKFVIDQKVTAKSPADFYDEVWTAGRTGTVIEVDECGGYYVSFKHKKGDGGFEHNGYPNVCYLVDAELTAWVKQSNSTAKQTYKGNGKHTWEPVTTFGEYSNKTERLRVPGGWLYKDDAVGGMTFVPVPGVVGHPI